MKVLELFAGTRSIGKVFEAHGHEVYSVEWNKDFENIDLYADISQLQAETILKEFGQPDVVWASPDCTSFSVAAIGFHRKKDPKTGDLIPQTPYAKFCDETDKHVLDLIAKLEPRWYFIENPRGGMRKMSWMQPLPRYTVTYCHYGDTRMKPTDIWTDIDKPDFLPPCKNGDPCHESAPRGTKTGTQGLKCSKERSVIPEKLCEHIREICEREMIKLYRLYKQALETLRNNDCNEYDIIQPYNMKVIKDGIVPTITTRPEGLKTAIFIVVK